MLLKTHLAINFLLSLLFSAHLQHKILFVFLVLFATMLPDIDMVRSYIGKKAKIISRIINFFSKHRGFFHSLTFTLILSAVLLFISPFTALAFFTGYSMHILADSFTIGGIEPFWPLKQKISGVIRTNGIIEKILFFVFLAMDAIFLFAYLF